METVQPADLFPEAFRKWIKAYSEHIEGRTLSDYRQYGAALASFFERIPLSEIDHNLVATYQHWRSKRTKDDHDPDEPTHLLVSKYRHNADHSRINNEVNSVLKAVLRKAGLWAQIEDNYRGLPVSKLGSGKSLRPEDREKLIGYCFAKARWYLAAHAIRLMFRHGVGPGELFNVRRRDVDLESDPPTISILDGAKCEGDRERTIPLSGSSLQSLLWIIERYEGLGGNSGEDFIFPHRAASRDGRTDFTRPMLSIKKAWSQIKEHIRENDAKLYEKIKDFRLYDCRVTAVTETLKSGKVSIHTAKKYFGHVSEAMQRRYYKPHLDTLKEVTDVLEAGA